MYPKELVKLLEKDGWARVSQSGSHLKMRKRKPDGNNSYTQQGLAQRIGSYNLKKNGTKTIVPFYHIFEYINTKENKL